ncbi:hypothetical protein D3P09_02750 [Paenibacillus pinisoli]|uniref:Uncharacterized protein n=1 Tax=Paenibacillus pinisoli TaxID=1276110 RepID=A0A3A6Q516_9BACL|nr:hypothetical protein D3P09_02750 [Paenibacillus pinisoli]
MVCQNRKIIMEHNGNLLVLNEAVQNLGGIDYKLVSYAIWTDKEKYEQDIPTEFIHGEQYIYCSNYAITDRDSMIRIFQHRFEK